MGRVHPDVRGRGVGRELMRWEHERALQALARSTRRSLRRSWSTRRRSTSPRVISAAAARVRRGPLVHDDGRATCRSRSPRSQSAGEASTTRRRRVMRARPHCRLRATTPSATTGGASRRPRSGGRTSSTGRTCAPTCRGSPSRATASSPWRSASVNEDDWEGSGLLERVHRPHRRHARPPRPAPRPRRHHGGSALGARGRTREGRARCRHREPDGREQPLRPSRIRAHRADGRTRLARC